MRWTFRPEVTSYVSMIVFIKKRAEWMIVEDLQYENGKNAHHASEAQLGVIVDPVGSEENPSQSSVLAAIDVHTKVLELFRTLSEIRGRAGKGGRNTLRGEDGPKTEKSHVFVVGTRKNMAFLPWLFGCF